ncbi:S1C family serine protease [Varunaivibrio sulfuroxidans]|uniref:S1C family serine protease n=1 Tax=Varunaivibrio sulfuroxidans TaxID=1773489 RepID=UPI001052D7B0|nr:trypsin-like peptidase domain-containing protein [Varunaivibrio sulfuroxidans]WES31683.1 trypsin-like peptidase domain-containing protein [Varunaivibrio sulfuroxidans]
MAILSACQTISPNQGLNANPGRETQTAARTTATQKAPEKKISLSFYTPFYTRADQMLSLEKEGKFADALRLYVEQKAHFATPSDRDKAALQALGDHFNATFKPRLTHDLNALATLHWPAPEAQWPAFGKALRDSADLLKTYNANPLLKRAAYRDPQTDRLQARTDALRAALKADFAARFAARPIVRLASLFQNYPLKTSARDFFEGAPDALKTKLSKASPEDVLSVADAFARDDFTPAQWTWLGMTYLHGKLGRGKPTLDHLLAALDNAKKAGFTISSVPDVKIDFAEVTSPTLLKNGQIDFSAEVKIDLPFNTAKTNVEKALGDKSDLLIIFNVAQAKARRKVRGLKKRSSTFLSGKTHDPNPAWEDARFKVIEAQSNLNATRNQTTANSYSSGYQSSASIFLNSLAGLVSTVVQDKALKTAQKTLKETPRFIDTPIYSKYQYEIARVDAQKIMTVRYYIIDRLDKRYFKSTFDVSENRTFHIAYNVNDADPQKKSVLSNNDVEKTVTDWEDSPITVALSDLIADYRKHEAESRPLPSETALRRAITKDRNTALARAKGGDVKSHVTADARFDSVVEVFTGSGTLGSGFYIAPDIVLTNWHVVENHKFVEMKTYQGRETFGKVVNKDVRLDLAAIRVQDRGKPVRFFHGKTLELGSPVEVIGHPEGLAFSITRGIISSLREHASINLPGGGGKDVLYIQTDAPINHGNSGGPLFLGDRVIGVNTWGVGKNISEGLNFSIHYSEIETFLRDTFPNMKF